MRRKIYLYVTRVTLKPILGEMILSLTSQALESSLLNLTPTPAPPPGPAKVLSWHKARTSIEIPSNIGTASKPGDFWRWARKDVKIRNRTRLVWKKVTLQMDQIRARRASWFSRSHFNRYVSLEFQLLVLRLQFLIMGNSHSYNLIWPCHSGFYIIWSLSSIPRTHSEAQPLAIFHNTSTHRRHIWV